MKSFLKITMIALFSILLAGCGSGKEGSTDTEKEDSNMVIRYRDDGTKSSANPVDENGYVHGVKTNFYEDGKTVHSRITYNHGKKHGPALMYYKNGQVHEHTSFTGGYKHGPSKKYYENGSILEELTYEQGKVMPGTKRYNPSGTLKTK